MTDEHLLLTGGQLPESITRGVRMSERRYASDYRLEEYITPKGKMATRRIYQGDYYRFRREEKDIHAFGKRLLLLGGVCLILLVPMLFNNTRIGRTVYVLLPVAFTLLPLYHVGAVGMRLRKASEPMTRQMRDLTDRRLRTAGVWLVVMLGVDILGCVVYLFRRGLQRGEVLCILGILLAFLFSLVVLKNRTYAKTEPVDGEEPGKGAKP